MAEKATKQLTYEQAREELALVVSQLEKGGLPLEESLALWERGEELGRICDAWLSSARERLDASAATNDETDDEAN